MHKHLHIQSLVAAMALAFIGIPPVAATGTEQALPEPSKMMPADPLSYSDRERMTLWTNEKQRLQAALATGQAKSDYVKLLSDNGYLITSINADKPDYLEYEVVKAANSYEVQIDLDKQGKGRKVQVATNVWRADATKNALRGNRMAQEPRYEPANVAYSDRDRNRMNQWTSEMDKLEKSLGVGKGLSHYTEELKKMGYQITATNDLDKNHVELEVVKGPQTYEVQIALDAQGNARKLDITPNLWRADATEKALEKSGK